MLADVCHSYGLPLRSLGRSRDAGGAWLRFLNYIPRKKSGQKLRRGRCVIVHGKPVSLPFAETAKRVQLARGIPLAKRLICQFRAFAKAASGARHTRFRSWVFAFGARLPMLFTQRMRLSFARIRMMCILDSGSPSQSVEKATIGLPRSSLLFPTIRLPR